MYSRLDIHLKMLKHTMHLTNSYVNHLSRLILENVQYCYWKDYYLIS